MSDLTVQRDYITETFESGSAGVSMYPTDGTSPFYTDSTGLNFGYGILLVPTGMDSLEANERIIGAAGVPPSVITAIDNGDTASQLNGMLLITDWEPVAAAAMDLYYNEVAIPALQGLLGPNNFYYPSESVQLGNLPEGVQIALEDLEYNTGASLLAGPKFLGPKLSNAIFNEAGLGSYGSAAYELALDTGVAGDTSGYSRRVTADAAEVLGFSVQLDGNHFVSGLTPTSYTSTNSVISLLKQAATNDPTARLNTPQWLALYKYVSQYEVSSGYYVVQPGDTASSIANFANSVNGTQIDAATLLQLNALSPTATLVPSTLLEIPTSVTVGVPSPSQVNTPGTRKSEILDLFNDRTYLVGVPSDAASSTFAVLYSQTEFPETFPAAQVLSISSSSNSLTLTTSSGSYSFSEPLVYMIQPDDPLTLSGLASELNLDPGLLAAANPNVGTLSPDTVIQTYGQGQAIPNLIQTGFGLTFVDPNGLVNLSTGMAYAVGATQAETASTVSVVASGQTLATLGPAYGIYQVYSVNGAVTLLGENVPGSFPPYSYVVTFTPNNGGYTETINTGETDILGGSYTVSSPVSYPAIFVLDDGATLNIGTALSSTASIVFGSDGTTLALDTPSSFGTTTSKGYSGPLLEGFAAGDVIDLKGLSYVSGMSSLSYSATTGVLQVTEGAKVADLYFGAGNMVVDDPFHLTPDASGGTLITNDAVACYALGTLILTDRGEIPVEALAIGDRVITVSGRPEVVKWIGRRSYAKRFLAANPRVQPIRFCAGSLGDGLPRRDLLVSPEHAMFLDGLLIPARHLADGRTILRERGLERVDYFHVELADHDVILAEGAPSESYLDDDSRGGFHNAHEFRALYPDAPAAARFYAPRVEHGAELEAVRRRLAIVAAETARAA